MKVSPHRMFIPLLVSFSLTGAGVMLIYFLNKKNDDDKQKAKKKKSAQQSKVIKIPRQFVPLIIGRGGSVIENIQQSTNTKISFKEEHDVDLLDRTCIITGNLENIKLAEEKIKTIIDNQPIIETYETWVPQRTFNSITERGGEILNQIQNSSSAKLILEGSLAATDLDAKRRVIIKGTADQIANALVQIEDKVWEDNEAKTKTENSALNRVPRNKTSPITTIDNNSKDTSLSKDLNYSTDIFDTQENEGFMEVFISAIENPSQFYIQVISNTNALLDDLVKDMTEYYNIEDNRELHILKNITAGQIVAAKFHEDNKWYRAEIISDLGDHVHDVYFVDFGDRDKVDDQQIFELRTDFLSLRQQAIECSLAGVKPCGAEWSAEACITFAELTALGKWEPRVAKIRGYKERVLAAGPSRREGSPIPCIEVYERHNDQLINIGKELIKLELASPEDESWSAGSSTLSLSRRTRSPESAQQPGDEHRLIEEIDLTLTPLPEKRKQFSDVIDLTTPSKDEPRSNGSSSRSFIEYERTSPLASNGNGHTRKSLPTNLFKPKSQKPVVNRKFIPAGYEEELSDDSDGFEIN